MSLFSPRNLQEKEAQGKLPRKASNNKKNNDLNSYIPSKEDEKKVEEVFDKEDFKFENPVMRSFAKYYILTGCASRALELCGIQYDSKNSRNVMASKMLRKLKDMPMFWDMIGLGYNDFIEIIQDLKVTKPDYVASIFLKLNKLDTVSIQHSGSVKIEFEKDLDE